MKHAFEAPNMRALIQKVMIRFFPTFISVYDLTTLQLIADH